MDSSIIKTIINVPEMDISYIKKGQKVTVSVDALPGKTWEGVIDFVSFKLINFQTFETKEITDNSAGEIHAGMLGRVSLLRRTVTDAVTTPFPPLSIRVGSELSTWKKTAWLKFVQLNSA